MKMIALECKNCHGILEVDLDNIQAYCPYCGSKLLLDLEHPEELLTEKEKTKQVQMQEYTKRIQATESRRRMQLAREYEKQEERKKLRHFKWWLILVAILLTIVIIQGQIRNIKYKMQNKISPPRNSYREVIGEYYEDVNKIFEKGGFTNIILEPRNDTTEKSSDGKVSSVSIDGESEWYGYYGFDPGVEVIIRYHTYEPLTE